MSKAADYGVLLVNLGTPDEPTAPAVRKYLAEFLHDKRVVDLTRWLWCPILHGIILRFRPARVAKLYQSVWTEQGSPLMAISRQQSELLASQLSEKSNQINKYFAVELAMTYGNPSIKSGLQALQAKGCDKIIVLPLYPQYSSATTASVFDRVAKAVKDEWNVPGFHFIRDYYKHPQYISALAASIREHWESNSRADKLLFSFHGIPKRYADNGDPYPEQCRTTARLVAEELGLDEEQWLTTFQSRFGREEWLKPYTDITLEEMAKQGTGSVQVICPGFAADCLETLEEIEEENKDIFISNGGQTFEYIPCLNSRADHIELFVDLIVNSIS